MNLSLLTVGLNTGSATTNSVTLGKLLIPSDLQFLISKIKGRLLPSSSSFQKQMKILFQSAYHSPCYSVSALYVFFPFIFSTQALSNGIFGLKPGTLPFSLCIFHLGRVNAGYCSDSQKTSGAKPCRTAWDRWMVEWMYACMNMEINLYLSYLPHDLPP